MECPKCQAPNPEESSYCSKCGTHLEQTKGTLSYISVKESQGKDAISFFPGDSFGQRYRIVEEIGRGGMGRVYKAEDKELEITVALKMIHPEYSSSPRFVQRFKKETLLARSISHENVIRIHDLGEIDKIKYISMNFIKGQNLKELIHTSGTLTIDTTISITRQICEGLKVAHQKGIVHRDLKPQNILIDNKGKVYTTDFGVAKSTEDLETNISGAIIGTPQYLSPEQAKGETANQTSDIYSLGIIMYEMLTGKAPFKSETIAGYIEKHLHEVPRPPSEKNPLIPSYLDRIILKCLEKDRAKRYQNIEGILKDLEEQKAKFKPSLRPPRVKKLLNVAYAVALVLTLLIVFYILRGKKEPPISPIPEGGRKSLAVMYFENHTGEERLDFLRKTLSESLIADLLQSQLIRVLLGDRLFDILKRLNLTETSSYSTEDLKRVAAQASVDYIIHGNYSKIGNAFRINTIVTQVSIWEPIGSESIHGETIDSIPTMLDDLTRRIKRNLELSEEEIAQDIDKDISDIASDSPKAMSYYHDGKRFYRESKFEESIKILERAVKIDPEFAMAYTQISINYFYLNNFDQAKKYLEKALLLIDKVSERERFLILGYKSSTLADYPQEAIEHYKELLKIYADDIEGIIYLGSLYRNLEKWDLAYEQFNKAIKIDKTNEIGYINLAYISMAKGMHDKAIEIIKDNRHVFSNQTSIHRLMSLYYLAQGKFDLALREAEEALSLEPHNMINTLRIGYIHHTKGDITLAKNVYKQLIENNEPMFQMEGRFWMAHLNLMCGLYDKCNKEVSQGLELAKKLNNKIYEIKFWLFSAYLNLRLRNLKAALHASNQALELASKITSTEEEKLALHFLALVHLEMNKLDEAEKTATQLKQFVEKTDNKKYLRHYYHLMGMISQQKNLTRQSIDYFESAFSLLPHQKNTNDMHAFYLDALAIIEEKMGDKEKAQGYYEEIISLTTGRLRWGDIYTLSLYRLGKIYQKKGWNGKAIDQYEKFLNFWKDADPVLPEKEDARNQLDLLKNLPRE